jgi:hypothetical protein
MLEWITPEYRHYEKSREWYAVVGVIVVGLLIGEIIMGDITLIILTILATVAFLLLAMRHPQDLRVEISSGGVRIQGVLHPYPSLHGFAVVESFGGHKLILESTKRFTPYMIVPLAEDVDPHEVRDLLEKKLIEEDLREPLSHIIFERLGF